MILTSFDQKASALYVKLNKKKITKTLSITDDVFLDMDDSGNTVGLEILFPKKLAKQIAKTVKHSKSVRML